MSQVSVRKDLQVARRCWRRAPTLERRLHWIREYVAARFALACYLGDSPTAASWRRMLHKLERQVEALARKDVLAHRAWAQAFEYAPRVGPRRTHPVDGRGAERVSRSTWAVIQHPHAYAEVTEGAALADEGDDSWEAFSAKIDEFIARHATQMRAVHWRDEDAVL